MNSVFLDTNFFLDIFDAKRERHPKSKSVLEHFLDNDIQLYTSSDIISTLSYFLQKKLDIQATVTNLDFIIQEVVVLSADNQDFIALNQMILQKVDEVENLKIDYEDCMQLYLADKYGCDYILTSDLRFCQGVLEEFQVEVVDLGGCLGFFNSSL